MNVMVLLSWLIGTITVVYGVFVCLSNRKSYSNTIFLFLTIEFALWSIFTTYALHYAATDAQALIFVRLVMFVTTPIWVTLYLLCKVYPSDDKLRISIKQKILIITLISLSCLFSLTPYMFKSVSFVNTKSLSFSPSWAIIFYLLNVIIFFILAAQALIKKFRHRQGLVQLQLRYISLSAGALAVAIIFTNIIAIIIFNTSSLAVYGTWLGSIIMLSLLSYPILQQRLYPVSYFAGKIIYYVTLVLYSFFIIAIAISLYEPVRLYLGSSFSFYLIVFIYAIFATISMAWLIQHLIAVINFHVINHGLNIPQLRAEFIHITNNLQSTSKINSCLFQLLETVLGTKGEALLFLTDHYRFEQKPLFQTNNWNNLNRRQLPITDLYTYFSTPDRLHDILIADEMPFMGRRLASQLNKKSLDAYYNIYDSMEKNKIAAIFPLISNNSFRGWLFLKTKKNNVAFYVQDAQFVRMILGQVIFKIDNTYLSQAFKNFNKTLQYQIDIATESRNEAYKKLQRSYNRLKILDQMKSEFVAIASHELRTPVTAVRGYLKLFQKEFGHTLTPKGASYLEVALKNASHNIELTSNMLTLSRIESGRYTILFKQTNLTQLIKQTGTTLAQIMPQMPEKKDIPLICEVPTEDLWVKAEDNKLAEVINNLVENAYKFTSHGSITINLKRTNQKEATIKIIDTGTGIEKSNFNKIFKKFASLNKGYSKMTGSGSGIGLYISKQIIRKHHGTITVSSVYGKGSTFTITLPLIPPPSPDSLPQKTPLNLIPPLKKH